MKVLHKKTKQKKNMNTVKHSHAAIFDMPMGKGKANWNHMTSVILALSKQSKKKIKKEIAYRTRKTWLYRVHNCVFSDCIIQHI